MIKVQLKKRFDTKSEAVQYLMGIVSLGNEHYFEFVGKKKKGVVEGDADTALDIEMANMRLTNEVNNE